MENQNSHNYLKSFKKFVKDQCQRFKSESLENIPNKNKEINDYISVLDVEQEGTFSFAKQNEDNNRAIMVDESVQTININTSLSEIPKNDKNIITLKIDLEKLNEIKKDLISLFSELSPLLQKEDLMEKFFNFNKNEN